ncbi:MAG: AAA domain-containing protein [Gammaproteobacteria bacterium]
MIRDKSFLAVASQSTDSNNVTFRIQMEERDLAFYSGLVKSDWDVYALSSLVTYGRMYAACHLKSKPSFYRQIYRANISAWPDAEIETKAEEESEERSNQGRRLNSIQQQVVEECVNAPNDSVRLIQGPPGTGKTTTILELLNRLTAPVDDTTARLNSIIYGQENTVQRIWVCAPSNKAVQILAKGFRKNNPNIPIFLVGIEKKLDASLRPIFFDTWLENKVDDCQKAKAAIDKVLALTQENFNDNSEKRNSTIVRRLSALGNALKNVQRHHDLEHYGFSAQAVDAIQSITRSTGRVREYKKSPEEFLENLKKNASDERHFLRERENEINTIAQDLLIEKDELLNRGQIIFSTLVTSGRKMMRDSEAPHTLIVDEAGQSTEAEMLIAFREETKRAFIVGDPKQLPATVQSRLNNLENNRFQQSMLGRLLDDCKQPHKMLNVQYRMHPEICEFPSNKYYEESLESDPSIDDRTTRIYDDEFIEAYQMINCKGKEKRDGTSHFNEKEIEIIITLLKHFQKNQHLDINISNDVGIISGYSAQVRKMKEALSQNGLPTEIINTVDGFQGGEKRIIMMSCVRTNPQNDIGFWRSAQRLNVAITRAQEALFIIGDANTLRNATYRDEPLDFAALIEDADRRGCIVNGNNLLRRLNPQDTENKSHPKPKRKKSKKPKQKAEEKASDEKTSSSSKKDIEKKYDAESGRFFTKPKKKKNRPPRSQKKNQNTSSNTPKK